MPLFNFQSQFAQAVESGQKLQTIRAKRKNRPKKGQIAYLYTGCRTKSCRKLAERKIKYVSSIRILEWGITIDVSQHFSGQDADYFAQQDGFKNFDEMREWFRKTNGIPFDGDLILLW